MKLFHFSHLLLLFAVLAVNAFVDKKDLSKSELQSTEYLTEEHEYGIILNEIDQREVTEEVVEFSVVIVYDPDNNNNNFTQGKNESESAKIEDSSIAAESEATTAIPDDEEEGDSNLQHKKLSLGKGRRGKKRPCKNGKKRCGGGGGKRPMRCRKGRKCCRRDKNGKRICHGRGQRGQASGQDKGKWERIKDAAGKVILRGLDHLGRPRDYDYYDGYDYEQGNSGEYYDDGGEYYDDEDYGEDY